MGATPRPVTILIKLAVRLMPARQTVIMGQLPAATDAVVPEPVVHRLLRLHHARYAILTVLIFISTGTQMAQCATIQSAVTMEA